MINFRAKNLKDLLEELSEEGVNIVGKTVGPFPVHDDDVYPLVAEYDSPHPLFSHYKIKAAISIEN